MSCGIYKIFNVCNLKYYVGSSTDIKNRWVNHRWALRNNRHPNTHLQNAWNKYGSKNFSINIEELILESKLLIIEQKYLDIAKKEKQKSYNQSFVAGKVEFTAGVRNKISVALRLRLKNKKNHAMYGKHHKKSSRLKMSLAQLGKKLSRQAIEKISGKNSVAHRQSVKKAKRNWWRNLRKNPTRYKTFCQIRARKSVLVRKQNKGG